VVLFHSFACAVDYSYPQVFWTAPHLGIGAVSCGQFFSWAICRPENIFSIPLAKNEIKGGIIDGFF